MNLTKLCVASALCLGTSACPPVAFEPDLTDGGTDTSSATSPPVTKDTIISVKKVGSMEQFAWHPFGRPDFRFEKAEAGQFTPVEALASGKPRCKAKIPNVDLPNFMTGPDGDCVVDPPLPEGTYRASLTVYDSLRECDMRINGRDVSVTFTVGTSEQTVRMVVGACKDPGLSARWSACQAATSAAECDSVYGSWVNNGTGWACECQSGDQGCPCTGQQDCVARCWDSAATDSASCALASRGLCAATSIPKDCFCALPTADSRQFICADPTL